MTMLVSLSDMKDFLGETTTTYDAFLTTQIETISEAIEGYCNRVFGSTSYTQTYYGEDYNQDLDSNYFYTYHYPVTSISQIREIQKCDDGSEDITTLTIDEFLLKPNTGKLFKTYVSGLRRSWFSEYGYYASRVEVTYSAGYATIPSVIQDVVYNLVEQRYNKKINNIAINFGNDVQRISVPGVMSIDFDYTLQSNERASKFGMILGNYSNVLDPYRSERALVGEIKENYVQ